MYVLEETCSLGKVVLLVPDTGMVLVNTDTFLVYSPVLPESEIFTLFRMC